MAIRHVGVHHRHVMSYSGSLLQSVYTLFVVPLAAVAAAALLLRGFAVVVPNQQISLGFVLAALGLTFARLCISYLFAVACAIPLAVLITKSAWAERVFLPVFDIMQSVPVLAFFPVIIVFFVHYGQYDSAAVFILFLSMLWNIVFSLVGGMHSIPSDIKSVGTLFGLRGFAYVREILLPSIFPYFVTGSLLAWAQGWNIIIVAEVLHVYIPGATAASDIMGIGSLLVHASAAGQTQTFVLAIAALVAAVALINFFIWQKLLKYAERFRFE
jgi:NitT/TauT family transport system permease protein